MIRSVSPNCGWQLQAVSDVQCDTRFRHEAAHQSGARLHLPRRTRSNIGTQKGEDNRRTHASTQQSSSRRVDVTKRMIAQADFAQRTRIQTVKGQIVTRADGGDGDPSDEAAVVRPAACAGALRAACETHGAVTCAGACDAVVRGSGGVGACAGGA